MLVCHCQAVNERRIRQAIADGARDEDTLARACGAGAECGGCLPAVTRLLEECLDCPSGVPRVCASPTPEAPRPEETLTSVGRRYDTVTDRTGERRLASAG